MLRHVGRGRRAMVMATLATALLVISGGAPAVGQSPEAQDPAPEPAPAAATAIADVQPGDAADTLEAALADSEDGRIRVIVYLDLDVDVEASLSSAGVTQQRSSISDALSGLGAQLNGTGSEILSDYEVVPAAVVMLDEAGLERLHADDAVQAITLDRPIPLALDVSTGIIDSDLLNAAGIRGDNFEGSTGGAYEVAILDSGVLTNHQAFTGRMVAGACFSRGQDGAVNGVGDCPNGGESQIGVAAGNACDWSTQCDHGTHVAGIAAGAAFSGGGHEGVASGAGIVSVQVGSRFTGGNCGSAPSPCWLTWFSDVDRGLQHVLSLKNGGRNIASVNLSLGGGRYFTEAECDALAPATRNLAANLTAAGVAVIAAAGNNGFVDSVGFPACLSPIYTVSSTDDFDVPSWFTNSNAITDWWAPGSDINAAISSGVTARADKSGTSMATPHVAGAFALLRECIGNSTPAAVAADLKATGVNVSRFGVTRKRINVLQAATRNVPNNNFTAARVIAGYGLVNNAAFNVCADAQAGEPGPTPENSIWFSWKPLGSGTATISTNDGGGNATTFDTELTVFTGSSLGGLSQVAYDDNSGDGERSLVTFAATAGTTYRIRVDGVGGETGRVNLRVQSPPPLCAGQVATIVGTPGNNSITGTAGNDVIFAGEGNDTISASSGNDVICAGAGNDVINGGPGNDKIYGEGGTDTVTYSSATAGVTASLASNKASGGAGADTFNSVENLTGSSKSDILRGNGAANVIRGGGGNDNIGGGSGNDQLSGDAGNDTLDGGDGNDVVSGGAGNDLLLGGDGADTLNGGDGTDIHRGGAGNDKLNGGDGPDKLFGDGGNDTLKGEAGADELRGGNGKDAINGGAANDKLFGDADNDSLNGAAGNDIVSGGAGVDFLAGGDGADTLNGEAGNDTLRGGTGNDKLNGGNGNDKLFGEAGADAHSGGAGNDTCNGGPGADTATTCEIRISIP